MLMSCCGGCGGEDKPTSDQDKDKEKDKK